MLINELSTQKSKHYGLNEKKYQGSALVKTPLENKEQRIGLIVPAETRNAVIDIANENETTFTNAVILILDLGIKQYQSRNKAKESSQA